MIKKYFNNIQTCLIFLNFRDKKELIFFNQQTDILISHERNTRQTSVDVNV